LKLYRKCHICNLHVLTKRYGLHIARHLLKRRERRIAAIREAAANGEEWYGRPAILLWHKLLYDQGMRDYMADDITHRLIEITQRYHWVPIPGMIALIMLGSYERMSLQLIGAKLLTSSNKAFLGALHRFGDEEAIKAERKLNAMREELKLWREGSATKAP